MSKIRNRILAEFHKNPTIETPEQLNCRIYRTEIDELQAQLAVANERMTWIVWEIENNNIAIELKLHRIKQVAEQTLKGGK